ncbi:DNA topology modulation protein [Streptococcus iniae]
MKIVIIGHSGSGKSTLANFLGQHVNCKVLHLDKVHFAANWQERTVNDMVLDISTVMQQDHWIIEGNYSNCLYEERMKEADCIIYFNFNRFTCFYRAFKRYLNYRGQTRPDMAEDCIEKFDFEFMKWILFDGRTTPRLRKYKTVIARYPHKTIILNNQKQLHHYMNSVK